MSSPAARVAAEGSPSRRGRSRRAWQVPEPDGEPVAGAPERDVEVELVDDPEPEPKSAVGGAACGGDEACQAIGRARAGVVNGDHDSVRSGPDAHGCRRAAVVLG